METGGLEGNPWLDLVWGRPTLIRLDQRESRHGATAILKGQLRNKTSVLSEKRTFGHGRAQAGRTQKDGKDRLYLPRPRRRKNIGAQIKRNESGSAKKVDTNSQTEIRNNFCYGAGSWGVVLHPQVSPPPTPKRTSSC